MSKHATLSPTEAADRLAIRDRTGNSRGPWEPAKPPPFPARRRFPALISATCRCIAAFGDHSEAELETRFGIGNALKRAGLPALQDAILSAARALSNQLCGEVLR
jgi:hypothetical protein